MKDNIVVISDGAPCITAMPDTFAILFKNLGLRPVEDGDIVNEIDRLYGGTVGVLAPDYTVGQTVGVSQVLSERIAATAQRLGMEIKRTRKSDTALAFQKIGAAA